MVRFYHEKESNVKVYGHKIHVITLKYQTVYDITRCHSIVSLFQITYVCQAKRNSHRNVLILRRVLTEWQ